jgi:molybdopterin-dependent oxidoreductase alpha subunit
MSRKPDATIQPYDAPAGGWGALKAVGKAFRLHEIPLQAPQALLKANHDGGFDCPGCAWPDSPTKTVDTCEQGMKAVAAELTRRLATPEFFATRTLAELRAETDFELEDHGRLTHPLRFDAATDTYQAIGWDEAFALVGQTLRGLRPDQAAFYTSGRSSNEASFLWQLFARAWGTNNLPDSSNLCHEPSGYAMKQSLGTGKGTATLADFEHADAIFVFGHNPATNHPRMMGTLHEAARRGATVLAFNPLVERGFENFADPQSAREMLTNQGRRVAQQVYQVRIGGDLAAVKGICKAVLEADAHAQAAGEARRIDTAFIAEHTQGFDAFVADLYAESWPLIETESGLSRAQIEQIADVFMRSPRVLATWCMGITHHENAVATIQMIVNLLLLGGHVGREGCGAVPVRGHSNVQGDRTQGITTNPPPRWLDNLEQTFGVTMPREPGRDAVATIEGLIDGSVRAFLSLGGNFAAAAPDSARLFRALGDAALTVHIATKFNRSHCYPGRVGLVLPCLGRTDRDVQDGALQCVTVEDSMSMVHRSFGMRDPVSAGQRSEPAIVAGLAHATVGSERIDWPGLARDYGAIRDRIEASQQGVFDGFGHYNERIAQPGGFWLPNAARSRVFKTTSGRAEFKPHAVSQDGPVHRARQRLGDHVLALMTIRTHDQYNTTVYGLDDRYRGIYGGRHVVLINAQDIARLGFERFDFVDIHTASEDGIERSVAGFKLVPYDIPVGCVAAYFPEATPLLPLGLHAKHTRTPAAKEIPVWLAPAVVARPGGV